VIYGLLLQLYPRTYLQRHREELLQNFQDLEQELPSRAAVWWFIARDLAVSLRSELSRTFWGQTAIVFTLLSLLLAIAHLHPGKLEPYLWSCSCGYALGWFAGWFGWNWRMTSGGRSPRFVRSFHGQAAMVVCTVTIVLATAQLFPDLQARLVLAGCYGAALAWITGWCKSSRRMSL
jgi:hypothetical protein